MPETTTEQSGVQTGFVRHRGRASQIPIYLGKFLRMFLYQNDWKVLPMAAVIAGLLAMVTKSSFFLTMEGTKMGAFALTCGAIWNGCFNSIQVICRERDVIKREHRAGMHISSYMIAHLLYQALLCLLQSGITMYVFYMLGVAFPGKALFTRWAIADIGITVFLITFAADALSLLVSSLARTTTAAMTIMPFVLILQLVFSGGMMELPEWSGVLTDLTISKYGLNALSAQADYNHLPCVSLWWTLDGMRESELTTELSVGQVMDYLADESNPGAKDLRELQISRTMTLRELAELVEGSDGDGSVKKLLSSAALLPDAGEKELTVSFTLGELADGMAESGAMAEEREKTVTISTTIGRIIDTVGPYRVYQAIQDTAGASNRNPDFAFSRANVAACWGMILLITLVNAALATVVLEFIDKDRR